MKIVRNNTVGPKQETCTDPTELVATPSKTLITQSVMPNAWASGEVSASGEPLNDDETSVPGSRHGRLRHKASSWFKKLSHRYAPAHSHIPPVSPRVPPPQSGIGAESFQIPDAMGPTLLAQTTASAEAHAEGAASAKQGNGPAQYLDASLVSQLLRRESPKTETFAQLSAAPVERALDSILADEIICHMPAHLVQPIDDLGQASADLFMQTDAARRNAWVEGICDALRQEFPRPWSTKAAITTQLCDDLVSAEVKAEVMVAFLRKHLSGGFEAMAAMAIMRAMYQSAERKGFASHTVPFISQANNFYVNHMLDLTGRIYVKWGAEKPKHQGVGLTAYGAPSPVDAAWMQPATISSHLYQPNPNCSVVARDLAYGNPYGVGISGSTNIMLFAAGYFNALGSTHIDMMDMATSMAALLCYNGGHSFNEVYAAAKMYPEASSTSLAPLANYHSGHARGLFIEQSDPQDSWLAEAGFKRLSAFVINCKKTGKT